MQQYSIEALTGNPFLDEAEILDGYREDVRQHPRPSDALIDSVAAEMAEAFGWDVEPTEEETEAQYAASRCDEAELLARYPGLQTQSDSFLIEFVGNPPGIRDDDEVIAVAAILLTRRLSNVVGLTA